MEEKSLDGVATKPRNGKNTKPSTVVVREFEPEDQVHVQRIFSEGMKEMIFDTAVRGLRHHPESLLLYLTMAAVSFVITMSWWVVGLLPAVVLCGRYFCSRRVIRGYLEEAMSNDMGHLEEFYKKSPNCRLWVAVREGQVVGVVAMIGYKAGGFAELRRMSVDRRCRRCGVGMALGFKVLEFALTQGYATVVLGTTAYSPAAHQLYQRLGFQCSGITNGYMPHGATQSLLDRIFYRVCHHHYRLEVKNMPLNGHEPLWET
ncbi:N-acetylaspartate synthetase-like isoform X1 [Phyllopteryx taeniolatus]|uniref:N-acetylaspartate synthetase-like isoform X1 n=1 Tax=Phyllopteryx taeniolatus TaxID=161469 RepID=UPI002AD33FDE|nr:N-acetylaspartate synthetase-like isoform X1 [Phyllopteryx taeniolatus]